MCTLTLKKDIEKHMSAFHQEPGTCHRPARTDPRPLLLLASGQGSVATASRLVWRDRIDLLRGDEIPGEKQVVVECGEGYLYVLIDVLNP